MFEEVRTQADTIKRVSRDTWDAKHSKRRDNLGYHYSRAVLSCCSCVNPSEYLHVNSARSFKLTYFYEVIGNDREIQTNSALAANDAKVAYQVSKSAISEA